ncbi:killer cell lectin-like receptor subfamily I member 1 isoform X1 [Loxodonta africana]|uniref:killer cell lectin-like receptor subfamily I member 1 isoform X1 n=1 Tax=Loxodonta africana TaxID=9785 RepID=UPI0030D3FAE2
MFVFNLKSRLEVLIPDSLLYSFIKSTLPKFYLDSCLSFSYKNFRFILQVDIKKKKHQITETELKQFKTFQEKKMPKNKQNKGIVSRQEASCTEWNFSRSQEKQKIPKTDQSTVMSSEQEVIYVELKCHKSSHLQLREKRKDPQSSALHVITGTLGVLCVVLMTTVGILLANLFSSKGEQNRKTSFIPTLSSMNGSIDLCLDHWIGFENRCVYLFNGNTTWPESYAACEELNFHLLKIGTTEELKILRLFGIEGWINLKQNKTDRSLLWKDGTRVNQSLVKSPGKENHTCAYVRGMYTYFDDCSSRKSYVCEL